MARGSNYRNLSCSNYVAFYSTVQDEWVGKLPEGTNVTLKIRLLLGK